MAFRLRGTHVPHRKNTQDLPVFKMEAPAEVTIPMSMHIGKPAKPVVAVGDSVRIGTLIGQADGEFSSPVYASVSGKVTALKEYLLMNGGSTTAVVIESDGAGAVEEGLTPPIVNSAAELVAAVKNAGLVGLGGAGFPTHIKLAADPERMEYLVINGAECEPYVTSDTMTMLHRGEDMAYAIRVLQTYLGFDKVIIGIENNKKSCIHNMKKMAADITEVNVEVASLPSVYPQGGEKVLVYHTVGRRIPAGKLPIDVGCVVLNCTTLATIGAYLKTGMPLVEKCVTVDGGAVTKPQNVLAPIGTSFEDLFAVCGGLKEAAAKLIYGGPMMGITVADATAPVLKNTNAVLALTAKEAKLPKTTACIRCGACINVCPFGLSPVLLAQAYDRGDTAALEQLSVDSCMECGCCSYLCPANRPLVQKNKLSKQLLREKRMKEASQA